MALIVGLGALAVIALIHVIATLTSNRHPRAVVEALGYVVHPVQRALSRMQSNQHYREQDISSFHRLNGYRRRPGSTTASLPLGFATGGLR